MKTLSPFRRRGMIAILFLSFGFLIFSYLVITGQVASKTTFVGKEGLDTSLGGQNYQRVLFYYHLAGTYALDDALLQHAAAGGQRLGDECKVAGYTLWASEHCTFHVEDVDDSFLKFFDEAFHQHLSRVSPLLGVGLSNTQVLVPDALQFEVADTSDMRKEFQGNWFGVVRPKLAWKTERLRHDTA